MEAFIYNKFVTGKNFIGRKNEVGILCNLLALGEDVTIYEPPKTGKSSVIQQAFFNMRIAGRKFSLAQLSLLNIRTTADLMTRMGTAMIRAVATTPSEYEATVSKHLAGTHFVFDREMYDSCEAIVSLNWDIDDNDITVMLTLPYRLAGELGHPLYVILDEFQNIMLTEDGDSLLRLFEQVLKDTPQAVRKTASWIMNGSQLNAMKDIFENKRFFYRRVERVKLGEIDTKEIVDTLVRSFLAGGKVVERDLLTGVCKLFKGHITYINHFASICNSLTKGYIMEPIMNDALDAIIAIHEPRFVSMMNDLTTYQLYLLRAIVDGYKKFSSADVIRRYSLNSSANVRRLKDALCKKEIVTFNEKDEPEIIDPLFEYWVTKYFFEVR